MLPLFVFVLEVDLRLLKLLSKSVDLFGEGVTLVAESFDSKVLLLNVGLEVLLLLKSVVVLAFFSLLVVTEFFIVLLQFLDFLLLTEHVILHLGKSLLELQLLVFELRNKVDLLSELLLELGLLGHHLGD